MTEATLNPSLHSPLSKPQPNRLVFVDNLRWCMILLVISMHAADTYSPLGNWYFTDRSVLSRPELLTFAAWQMTLQAFFMGLLFFIAAVFTPSSFDRKGARRFCVDRLRRLGLPVLFYMFALGPITEYFFSRTWTSTAPTSFANEWVKHIRNGEFLQENGPLWFCLLLLVFSLLYAGWRTLTERDVPRTEAPSTARLTVFVIMLAAAGAAAHALDLPKVLNVDLGDSAQYVFMFVGGLFAARGDWVTAIDYRRGLRWLALGVVGGVASWLYIMDAACAFCRESAPAPGWRLVFRVWEAFMCVSLSVGLICLFREHVRTQNRFMKYLSDNAFAVYVFHPPIVILLAKALHGIDLVPLAKFAALAIGAAIVTYVLSGVIFRRIPYLRAIL